MNSVQRRFASAWEKGSETDRYRAALALERLTNRKPSVDLAARARDDRKTIFRSGGYNAAHIVWVPAMETHWDSLGGRTISKVRDTGTWRPAGKTADIGRMRLALARHLYGNYRTPVFLDAMWLAEPRSTVPHRDGSPQILRPSGDAGALDLAFASLWKAVAGGVSLHKACLAPRGLLSRKETHLFLQAPDWCSVARAMWWARIMSVSGSRATAEAVARSRIPDMAGDPRQAPDPRWTAVARFIAAPCPTPLRGEELSDILDWVNWSMRASPNWGIEGRTVATIRRASSDWHKLQARQKAWAREHWDGFPIDPWSWDEGTPGERNHRSWKIEQILTGKELAAEGHAQRHCVGSYLDRCSRGDCAILSLSMADHGSLMHRRALTVELNRNWRIVQVKGFANRAPDGSERRALERWANGNGIEW